MVKIENMVSFQYLSMWTYSLNEYENIYSIYILLLLIVKATNI